ncbi:MAG TPA: MFS transporter [Xanthobacteraceae bacterium]|nr:MFS transporter [Xanthobacteraceae bacterium]
MSASPLPPLAAPLSHEERRLIVLGTLLPVFLGSLDQTILASALPTIGREIGHAADLPWLITAYLLAATAATPLYGKISDIRGRRFTLCIAIVLYMAGSLICALAPNFFVLVLGRAVHGIGGGGLTSLAMVVLGDLASPKERGKYYAYFSATYTTAGASGPLLGGAIADYLHWSVIFWMNVPLGLIAFAVVSSLLRKLPRHERPHRLDIIGAGLIVVASVSFMLMLNIGGVRYSWASAPVLMLLALAGVAAAFFVLRLVTAPEPLIPLTILKSGEARYAIAANAFGWGAIFGLNIYLPAYLQNVLGLSATHAGLSLMILMATVNISAGVAGQIIGRVQHYKTVPMLAVLIAIASVATLGWRADAMTMQWFVPLLALIGIGFGPIAPLSTVVLQNSVPIHQFGTAIGTMNFTRSLYSTILIAAFGAVVVVGGSPLEATAAPARLSAEGFRWIFFAAAASLAMAFLSMWLLEEKPLQTRIAE